MFLAKVIIFSICATFFIVTSVLLGFKLAYYYSIKKEPYYSDGSVSFFIFFLFTFIVPILIAAAFVIVSEKIL